MAVQAKNNIYIYSSAVKSINLSQSHATYTQTFMLDPINHE